MHNALNRLQNVFGFFTTVASFVALAIAIVSLVSTPVPDLKDGSLKMRNVQVVKGRPHYYSQKKEEYAHIKFDLDVDLSTLFTWNTKQVFLYITASYPSLPSSPNTAHSSSIIWDAILPHPLAPAHHNTYIPPAPKPIKVSKKASPSEAKKHPGILKLDNQRPKYQITDPTGKLANRGNATLELHYNIQPWVGALTWGRPKLAEKEMEVSGFSETDWLARMIAGWTQREVGKGGRSKAFALPGLKEKGVTGDEMKTAKGKEERRGAPS